MAEPTYAAYPSLKDRSVFITGGADGIGRALVEEFSKQGSRVGFADKNVDKAKEAVASCDALGVAHRPRFYQVDLVDIGALQRVCAEAVSDLGEIRVLVNNAANDDRHGWREMTADYWDDRLNTNLRHYFFTIQALAPGMIQARDGAIINIGSS
jgi:NAD(P)-dependent dehydrogenase (short-subunit alcohol dehydrogenase family)